MAPFLSRVFSVRRLKSANKLIEELPTPEIRSVKGPHFCSAEQVRVMLFRERCGQDRRLVFDSKAVKKADSVNAKPHELTSRQIKESSIEKSFKLSTAPEKDCIYEWQKQSADEDMLKEMIFGSLSTSYQGVTVKVHTIRAPLQIMITIVFPAPPMGSFQLGDQELEKSTNSTHSANDIDISKNIQPPEIQLAHSVPVDVPGRPYNHCDDLDSFDNSLQSCDGYSSLPGFLPPQETRPKIPRSGSHNSLQRRLLRNKATCIEFGLPTCANKFQDTKVPIQNRAKLGLSIAIFNKSNDENTEDESQFHDFIFTHISLIERHVMDMKNTVIKAYLNRKKFIHFMYEGSRKLQRSIEDLYTAPRLQFPAWLNIISSTNHHDLCMEFIMKFTSLLKEYEKKETNFFVSMLLTTVLTHHLAWVPTVIPTDADVTNEKHSHKHMSKWVDELAKSRPYNPLWVQLGDLYGALSPPYKLSKTVITGAKPDVIMDFLQVFSYFIRCSDVNERVDDAPQFKNPESSSNAEDESCDINDDFLRIENSDSVGNLDASLSSDYSSNLSEVSKIQLNDKETCDLNRNKLSIPAFSLRMNPKCVVTVSSSDNFHCTEFVCESSVQSTSSCDVLLTKKHVNSNEMSKSAHFVPSSGTQNLFSGMKKLDQTLMVEESTDGVTCGSLGYESLEEKSKSLEQLNDKSNLNNVHSCDLPVALTDENSDLEYVSELPKSKKCDLCNLHIDGTERLLKVCICSKTEKTLSETTEEGYHSMEEAQSPQHEFVPTRLSELLKQFENWSPEGLTPLNLPLSENSSERHNPSVYKSLGWSLMAGVTKHYLPDFCLQGIHGTCKEEEITADLLSAAQVDVFGEPISEAVCILANTDTWEIKLLSSNADNEDLSFPGYRIVISNLIANICETILNIKELDLPAESCIILLEDMLQELYFHSLNLAEYLSSNRPPVIPEKVASSLKVHVSDLPLLMAIATIHSPHLSYYNQRW